VDDEHLRALCERASQEKDPARLLQLTKQICETFDKARERKPRTFEDLSGETARRGRAWRRL
jgi:nitrate reductase assembly molybdenum cofactor insertion protein NarJ